MSEEQTTTAPRVLVTGASGFIGAHAAAELARRGAQVLAVSRTPRPASDWDRARAAMQAWTGGEGGAPGGGIQPLACDLSFPAAGERLEALVEGVSAVVHAAARLAGGDVEQARDTLGPTRALVAAMEARAPSALLVLVSSFSVYDIAAARAAGGVLDEDAALEAAPEARDAYTRAKLGQEAIVRAAGARGLPVRILRPAYVYGPGRLDCAHLGVRKGRVELAMGDGPVAAIPVAACAEALALAALAPPPASPEVFNVVDADAPDRGRWRAAMPAGSGAWLTLPVPGAAARAAAGLLGARAPGFLRGPVHAARFQGVPVSDARLRAAFGWTPRHRFEAVAAMEAER
ncbi:NAD-dependent epimerase/dehydratase family protein [Albimonas pacifica]|uniref:Nucleoside-diphosphate-sugar epimerase n=1 Tax=Albimonas pacifica TaxID=1114924 RepID=A0A1I3IKQ8_9RHOB|nr:NAD-dependent epimerase/dehydratase family protein [Albimonas pacifica]SFI48501.1 Nucleoside-diphosphate-sugar epimerase [Albimonas pacifica]